MTTEFARTMKRLLGTEIGRYYPGPIPYTPVRLTLVSATTRRSVGCVLSNGFAQNPKTHRPAARRKVLPVEVDVVRRHGQWLMQAVNDSNDVSCTRVRVYTPRF